MNKLLSLLWTAMMTLLIVPSQAQIHDPVKWQFSAEDLGNNEYMLHLKANIEDGWYVYSQSVPEDGPIATSFLFEENSAVEMIGSTSEDGPKISEGFDAVFELDIKKFAKEVTFSQKVKATEATTVKGSLEFMTCDDSKCLPPDIREFAIAIPPVEGAANTETEPEPSGILDPVKWEIRAMKASENELIIMFDAAIEDGWYLYSQHNDPDEGPVPTSFNVEESDNYKTAGPADEQSDHTKEGMDPVFEIPVKKFAHTVRFTQKVEVQNFNGQLKGWLEFMTCDNTRCLPPDMRDFTVNLQSLSAEFVQPEGLDSGNASSGDGRWPDYMSPIQSCGETQEAAKGLWLIFIFGFVGGLLALLTPCVFPMIPMTVTFFTKQSKTKAEGIKNAWLYGLFIIVIYVGIGFLVTQLFGPDILNEMASNGIFNMIFFLVFIVFAISFFGYFEITIPSALINKADSASDRGGLIGIFFMAFTLSLVSFSCTGPIIGTLLVEAAISGAAAGPLMGMFGFALALALPFALFAAFPGWLNSLPKSGGWLNNVKVILAFLELALALKFLSNVDLAYHWGFLKRELFVGLWIVTFLGMAAYLFGLIRFPHDSPMDKVGTVRKVIGTLTLVFVGYLGMGLYTGNLALLAGLAPPGHYSYFNKTGNKCPHDLMCFKDYEEGMAYAKAQNKPVLIDFTGHTCVNCRKMEDNVWVEPDVLKVISEDYVLISLYVDDKQELPEEEQYTSNSGKLVKTVGNKWSDFQIDALQTNAQPYYVLVTPDERLLTQPVGYMPDANEYLDFLKCGLDVYEQNK